METYILRFAVSHEQDMVTPSIEVYRDYEHVRTYVAIERPFSGDLRRWLIDILSECGHGYQTRLL